MSRSERRAMVTSSADGFRDYLGLSSNELRSAASLNSHWLRTLRPRNLKPAAATPAPPFLPPSICDFPAEHWGHLRTTNPIESTFATVRLRQRRTKGCGSREASLTMVFMLARQAERHWRRLNGSEVIVHVLEGKVFKDGLMVQENAA